MLHGGRADGLDAVDDRSASWRRSRWMMTHITGGRTARSVGLWLLRYGGPRLERRGRSGPLPRAGRAVGPGRGAGEHGDLPVVLLGHSMGARTAVAVADDPSVTGVVALAPWLPAGEPRTLRDKHLAAAHGRSDRITSARATRAFVRGAERVAASAEFHDMGRVGHHMFRNVAGWNDFAISRSLAFIDASARSGR